MAEEDNIFDAMPKADDEFEIDLTKVENKGFTIVDRGRYVAQVVEFIKGVSAAGNKQFIWTFRIMQGDFKGVELRYWTALTPNALWKIAETLESLGIKASGSIIKFTRSDIIKKQCIIEVEEDIYENREQNKIVKTYPIISKKKEDIPIEITEKEAKKIIENKKEAETKDTVKKEELEGLFG